MTEDDGQVIGAGNSVRMIAPQDLLSSLDYPSKHCFCVCVLQSILEDEGQVTRIWSSF